MLSSQIYLTLWSPREQEDSKCLNDDSCAADSGQERKEVVQRTRRALHPAELCTGAPTAYAASSYRGRSRRLSKAACAVPAIRTLIS